MAVYRTIGSPLRKIEVGEGALLVDILTPDQGVVRANAPGARKLRSRKRGNFEIGLVSRFSFAEGKTRDIMLEVELVRLPAVAMRNQTRSMFVMKLCKLSGLLFVEADDIAYYLLANTLSFADAITKKLSPPTLGKTSKKSKNLAKLLNWVEIWYEYAALRWAGLIEPLPALDPDPKSCNFDIKQALILLKDPEIRRGIKQLTSPALSDIMSH